MTTRLSANVLPQGARSMEDALAVVLCVLLWFVVWFVVFRVRYGATWLTYVRRSMGNRWFAVSLAMGLAVTILPFALLGEEINAATLTLALGGFALIIGLMWVFILILLYPPDRNGSSAGHHGGQVHRE